MDALSERLGALRLEHAVSACASLRAGGRIVHEPVAPAPKRRLICHQVLAGRCELVLPGGDARSLSPGQLVLLRDVPHSVRAGESGGEQMLLRTVLDARFAQDPGSAETGAVCTLLCGAWDPEPAFGPELLACLPPLVSVAFNDRMHALQAAVLALLADEPGAGPGSDAVQTRLAEAMLVQAVATFAELAPAAQQHLLRCEDPIVSRCLALMHGHPAEPWTLPRLASEVNTSRSVLAERFNEVVGEPPMSHLTKLRLAVAARLLRQSGWNIARVAEAAGYQSEPAFNRAFRRQFGAPPAAWRRRQAEGEAAPNALLRAA